MAFKREVVSYRNSTSNHNDKSCAVMLDSVVSYRNSTSNHNRIRLLYIVFNVVSYRNSTSNHNYGLKLYSCNELYLIEILHQTTTGNESVMKKVWLYLIEILHQTTTVRKI